MKKHIDFCFLYHPHTYETDPGAQLGLGLLSLASYAYELGASVEVINQQHHQNVLLSKTKYKCLCLYGCMVDEPMITQIVHTAIHIGAAEFVLVGGPIAKTINYINNRTMIVDGPGEDLIESLVKNKVLPYNGRFIAPALKKNINAYPFPNRHLVKGPLGGNIYKHRENLQSTTILTSRGCRYNCAFCTSGQDSFHEDYEIGRIEREIEDIKSLGIQDIRISDDNLLTSKTRFAHLMFVLSKAKMRWRASIRVRPNDIEIYRMMREAGCEEVSFGVESGDQHVLNTLKKGTTVEANTTAVKNARAAGIPVVRALMMMGTPGETEETLGKNIAWTVTANPTHVSLKMFVPYPGTAIGDEPWGFGCSLDMKDSNNSAYRPDGSEPKANIRLFNSDHDIEKNFNKMKMFLEIMGKENRG